MKLAIVTDLLYCTRIVDRVPLLDRQQATN